MAIERTYHCDGPDCPTHIRTLTPPPYLPGGWIEVRTRSASFGDALRYFCSWDCSMRHAAAQHPLEKAT